MLYAAVALASWLTGWRDDSGLWSQVLIILLGGALVAELVARFPARGPRRAAVLSPRRLRDLVPRWALGCFVLAGCALAAGAAGELVGTGWAAALLSPGSAVPAIVVGSLTILVVGAVLALTVRRPPACDPRSDAALRMRSARVASGMGTAVLAALAGSAGALPGFLITMAGLVAWSAITARPATSAPRGRLAG